MTPAEAEYWVHQASLRTDWQPLDATELGTVFYCSAAGATSASQSSYMRRLALGHLEGIGRDLGEDGARRIGALTRLLRAGLHTPGDVDRAMYAADEFTWVPPFGSVGPLHLALLEDGSVREFDPTTERPLAAILTSTVDVMFAQPSRLIRDGYGLRLIQGSKLHVALFHLYGDSSRVPASHDLELTAAALLASRYVETRSDVVGEVIVMHEANGIHDTRTIALADRQKTDGLVRQLVAETEKARTDRSTEGLLDYCVGMHCLSCPVMQRCTAWLSEIRAMGTMPLEASLPKRGLDDPVAAVESLLACEHYAHRVRTRLAHYTAKHGPVKLDDGRVWGPIKVETHRYDEKKSKTALASIIGRAVPEQKTYYSSSDVRRILDAVAEQNESLDVDAAFQEFDSLMVARADAVVSVRTDHRLYTPEPTTSPQAPEEPEKKID